MKDVKIYGLCLERIRHQIRNARARAGDAPQGQRVLIEPLFASEPEEVIDILELYDIGDRALLWEKLGDLAYTTSELLRERLEFDRDERGEFGLYVVLEALDEAHVAGGMASSGAAGRYK